MGRTLILVASESSCAQQMTLEEGLTITIQPRRAGALMLGADDSFQTFRGLEVAI